MTVRRQVFRGAAVIGVGQGLGQVLSFLRNVIVARLLGPEDFGIAATFALTVSLLEMISDLGADKLIIQAPDGDDPKLQATAQLWQFARLAIGAILILIMAWPLAAMFGVLHARWAFYWLALVPLMRGLMHLDIKRLQRHMRFGAQVSSDLGSQIIATALAWPLAYWLRDYSAMLWIVLVQTAAYVLCSHLRAERAYRWSCDRETAARLFIFGWPLLVNSLLMFGIFQGDRAIIGAIYSMHDLGLYAAATALAFAPSMFLGSIVSSITLPLLSRTQTDRGEFERRYGICIGVLTLIASLLVVILAILGPRLLTLIFGESYAGAGGCLVILGIAQSVRLLRVGTTSAAMALSDTVNSMWSNTWRIGGIVGAAVAAALGLPLLWIAAAALLGEILALCYSALRLTRRHGIAARCIARPILTIAPVVSAAVAIQAYYPPKTVYGAGLFLVALSLCCGLSILVASPGLRREIAHFKTYKTLTASMIESA